MKRSSGVLMHISSLPGPYGIGSFGKEAYRFVDFLVRTRQTYWQILPLTTTSYGDSPYQSFSAFAGNPNFIDLDVLKEETWLTTCELEQFKKEVSSDPEKVDYGQLFKSRREILDKAVARFVASGGKERSDYQDFVKKESDWLWPYVYYMTVKESFSLVAFTKWPEDFRKYDHDKVVAHCEEHKEQMDYHLVTQFWFFQQWSQLKLYANEQGIKIIGDMPIYVAHDSVEMWTHSELFKVNEEGEPLMVAGTPPDNFSDDGQYWGNPIYNWDYMKATGYSWWIERMKASFKLYDMIRIDHFRGFESYWEVPYGAPSSADGHWTKGPGSELFDTLEKALGQLPIIAEDLGFMTPEVIAMREHTGYPGMKILQFAFNGDSESDDMPHNYDANTVAYVGTHDNETGRGHYEDTCSQKERDQADHYLNRQEGESPVHAYHRGIASSVSRLAIYTMQDLLNLDNRARMNEPSTIGGNWQWRMREDAITKEVEDDLLDLTLTYYRARFE